MQKPDFNVGIIGGGPAGASLSAYLAKSRVSSVVLEIDKLPRPHVGDSLVSSSPRVFKELGFLEEMGKNGFLLIIATLVEKIKIISGTASSGT